jgi:hypothetical protein
MIARASGTRRHLLERLFNQVVFEYARAIRQRERVSPEVYRGFFFLRDPLRYFVLLSLSYVPVPMQKLMRRFLLWTSAVSGIPRRRTGSHFTNL